MKFKSYKKNRNYKVAFIYALCCPLTDDVRYVGKTVFPLNIRLKMHLNQKNGNSLKKRWVDSLKTNNLIPKIILLEEVDYSIWKASEKIWISKYNNLLNGNKGGGGGERYIEKYINQYKLFLLENYSKNTSRNYISCVSRFLTHFNSMNTNPIRLNSNRISEYIDTINDSKTQSIAISAIKLFYFKIINQPKKMENIKYRYKKFPLK